MNLLDRYSNDQIGYLLNEVDGQDLNSQKEFLTRWFVRNGGNASETEELLFRQGEFKQVLLAYRQSQKLAWEAKLKKDKLDQELAEKEKRWDSKHNCEIPKVNSHDPFERRFGGSGTKGSKSADVNWNSSTYRPEPVTETVAEPEKPKVKKEKVA